MAEDTGRTRDSLAAARGALRVGDDDLAAADAALADLLGQAHRLAVESAGRIDAVRSEIEAVVDSGVPGTPAGAAEFGRFLVAKNREIIAIVSEARDASSAKTTALQELSRRYSR